MPRDELSLSKERLILARGVQMSIAKRTKMCAAQALEVPNRSEFFVSFYAAFALLAAASRDEAASLASSHFTETSFETPGSCIVTP